MPPNNYFFLFCFCITDFFPSDTNSYLWDWENPVHFSIYLGDRLFRKPFVLFPQFRISHVFFLDNILFYVHIVLIISLFSVFWYFDNWVLADPGRTTPSRVSQFLEMKSNLPASTFFRYISMNPEPQPSPWGHYSPALITSVVFLTDLLMLS